MPSTEPPIAGEPAGEPVACHDVRRALAALSVRSQAVGALMAELGVSADAARRRLQRRSRAAGVSVDEVARALLAPYPGFADDGQDGVEDVG